MLKKLRVVSLVIGVLVLFFGFQKSSASDDQARAALSLELLTTASEGRDGAFDVAKEFAECWGMFDAIADFIEPATGAAAMVTDMRNTGNGAEVVAGFFWSGYSQNPNLAMAGISGGAYDFYAAILSTAGVTDPQMVAKMNRCGDLSHLQATIISEIRKDY